MAMKVGLAVSTRSDITPHVIYKGGQGSRNKFPGFTEVAGIAIPGVVNALAVMRRAGGLRIKGAEHAQLRSLRRVELRQLWYQFFEVVGVHGQDEVHIGQFIGVDLGSDMF